MIQALSVLLFSIILPLGVRAQCNGHQQLCNKRYNEVAYLTTHNAFNTAEDGFTFPNQTFGITRQLQDGVRALMLDVYDEGGVATVYHGFSFLGTATLASDLGQIKDFLDDNPSEIVTIIFESHASAGLINDVFIQLGLMPYLHVQPAGDSWPTLQEMIDADKRLIVFTDKQDALVGQEWYQYVWSFAVETDFENFSSSGFSCDFNRGDPSNDLFIVNHFVSDATVGIGIIDSAMLINQLPFFLGRMKTCQLEEDKFPNFPTVDFYDEGQTMAVVDSLNGIPLGTGIPPNEETFFKVYNNPSSNVFRVTLATSGTSGQFCVFSLDGKKIMEGRADATFSIDLTDHPAGIYHLQLIVQGKEKAVKLMKL